MKIQKALPVPLLRDFTAHAPGPSPRRFDPSGIVETIQRAFVAAGLNTQSGPMKDVTDTINQAMSAAGLTQHPVAIPEHGVTLNGTFHAVDAPCKGIDGARSQPDAGADRTLAGAFLNRTFTDNAGTRTYKLYVPASYAAESSELLPLIVMLHGCTQTPDDFAAGTRMNALADQFGFLVIYPAQATNANGSRCWNWFRPEDQNRDSGEPSLIAGITREVASAYRVDARRIFVAGLSAGASMAVILGAAYPELYAAIGAHSGLPYGAAHDMPSAFAAMQGGAARSGRPQGAAPRSADSADTAHGTPTIVFHGDHDRTVNVRNGGNIAEQATFVGADRPPRRFHVRTETAPRGRKYTRTDYLDDAGQSVVEHWLVHGAGHAWSGGSPNGTFTDPTGPDASTEMVRFFLLQRQAGTS